MPSTGPAPAVPKVGNGWNGKQVFAGGNEVINTYGGNSDQALRLARDGGVSPGVAAKVGKRL